MIRSSLCAAMLLVIAACDSTVDPVDSGRPSFAAAGGGAPVAWVNGSFHRPSNSDDDPGPELQQSATFDVQLLGDGSVRGHVRVRFHRPDGTLLIDLFEEVTCLVVDGPTAWIGTVAIREHLSEGQPTRLGRPVVWQVRDVGVRGDLAQRRIDFADCNLRPDLNLFIPSLGGDLHVIDRR